MSTETVNRLKDKTVLDLPPENGEKKAFVLEVDADKKIKAARDILFLAGIIPESAIVEELQNEKGELIGKYLEIPGYEQDNLIRIMAYFNAGHAPMEFYLLERDGNTNKEQPVVLRYPSRANTEIATVLISRRANTFDIFNNPDAQNPSFRLAVKLDKEDKLLEPAWIGLVFHLINSPDEPVHGFVGFIPAIQGTVL